MLPNSAPEGLLEVGRIGKPHGVRGDVFLSLTSDLEQRRSVGSELIIVEGGAQRTLTIATVRPQQDRWVVHFEGIDDRNAVEKLTNKYLYAEPIDGAEGLWVHQLIGSEVVDMAGTTSDLTADCNGASLACTTALHRCRLCPHHSSRPRRQYDGGIADVGS